MRKALTRLAAIGACAALCLGIAPTAAGASSTRVPESVPSVACPIAMPIVAIQPLERCGRTSPGSDDYGLGSLMWFGPDWGDPSIGTFA